MSLDHLEHLLQLEVGGDALGRPADVAPAAPPVLRGRGRVELVELGQRASDVHRHVGVVPAHRVLPVRARGRVPEVHGELGVHGDDHVDRRVPEVRGEPVGADHHRDPPAGVEVHLRRHCGGRELGVAGGDERRDLVGLVLAGEELADPLDPLGERGAEVDRLPRDGDDRVGHVAAGRAEPVEAADGRHEVGVDVAPRDAVGEDRHGPHRVGVAADGGEHRPVGGELGRQGLLDRRRRLGGVALAVVVDVPHVAPPGQGGDRDLDAEHRAQLEDSVVLLVGGGDGAGVELLELVTHGVPPYCWNGYVYPLEESCSPRFLDAPTKVFT